jgi:3-hydroxyacyl-[acyl-carrier-protein] dehydratase
MPRDIEEIRQALPLRYPYLMLDRIVEEKEGYIVARKNVTINEPFFQGHFPEPLPAIMPGTLILEAMAQTAAFLLPRDSGTMGYLVGIEKARFRRNVVPGDQLLLQARARRKRKQLVEAEVTASVEGELAATAIITLLTAREEDVGQTH